MAEYAGYLVELEVEISSSYTAVAQVRDISGPSAQADQIEVSHRDSRWRKYVAGMRDGGEVTYDIVFDPDHESHDPTVSGSVWDMLEEGTLANFRITFPGPDGDTTTATFAGFVSNFEIDAPLEDGLTASITVKISGEVTWAHVSA